MTLDTKTIETLIEIITREVLIAIAEQKESGLQAGARCQYECADDVCVHTCFDNAGHVVSAGAERLTSTLGLIPKDLNLAGMIDHTLPAGCTPDQIAQLCFEARKHGLGVRQSAVELCAAAGGVAGQSHTVIGFPLGATAPEVKHTKQPMPSARRDRDRHGRQYQRSRRATWSWSPVIFAAWCWPPTSAVRLSK